MQHHQKSSIFSQRVIKLVAILGSEGLRDRPGMPLSSTGFFDYRAKYSETPNTCCIVFALLILLALEVFHFSFSYCIISVPSSIGAPVIKFQ